LIAATALFALALAGTDNCIAADDPNASIAAQAATDEASLKEWLSTFEPLVNLPEIVSTAERRDVRGLRIGYWVTIRNVGGTTLRYEAYGRERIRSYQEVREPEQWKLAATDWCGTGLHRYELKPGEAKRFQVKVSAPRERERVLAFFQEDGTNRAGLIVLATEPTEP
jgi:hypothetical protein